MTTAELTALLATPAAFGAWLEAKEPGEVVAGWLSCGSNPIARFLNDHGAAEAMVHSQYVLTHTARGVADEVDMPAWATGFIGKLPPFRYPPPITAAECLRILDEIEQRIYEEDMQELTDWEASMKHA